MRAARRNVLPSNRMLLRRLVGALNYAASWAEPLGDFNHATKLMPAILTDAEVAPQTELPSHKRPSGWCCGKMWRRTPPETREKVFANC